MWRSVKRSCLHPPHGYAKSEAMPTDLKEQTPPADKPPLTPAAERALAEAAARRAEHERQQAEMPKEANGRGGLEPTRYGDWEKDGLTSDF
jgi:hypothetical protein